MISTKSREDILVKIFQEILLDLNQQSPNDSESVRGSCWRYVPDRTVIEHALVKHQSFLLDSGIFAYVSMLKNEFQPTMKEEWNG